MPARSDDVWVDVTTIDDTLALLGRDVVGPAMHLAPLPRASLGNDAGDSVIAALAEMLTSLPASLTANAGNFAADVHGAVQRVVAADGGGR